MFLLHRSRAYRQLRAGCLGGCALLVLLLAALCVLLAGWLWRADRASADGDTAIRLAAALPEQLHDGSAMGTFLHSHRTVELAAGGTVWLASTPDGSGPLVTDDRATLRVRRPDGSTAEWSHEFRRSSGDGIAAFPPQPLTPYFQPGANTVELILDDLWPPAHSSSPYYLVIVPAPSTQRTTGAPLARGGSGPTSPVPEPAATSDAGAGYPWLHPSLALLGLLGIALAVAGLAQRRFRETSTAPAMGGWLLVMDQERGERLPPLSLADYHDGVGLAAAPLRLLGAGDPAALAAIHPRHGDAHLVTRDGFPLEPLEHNRLYRVGPLVLEYRLPPTARVPGVHTF